MLNLENVSTRWCGIRNAWICVDFEPRERVVLGGKLGLLLYENHTASQTYTKPTVYGSLAGKMRPGRYSPRTAAVRSAIPCASVNRLVPSECYSRRGFPDNRRPLPPYRGAGRFSVRFSLADFSPNHTTFLSHSTVGGVSRPLAGLNFNDNQTAGGGVPLPSLTVQLLKASKMHQEECLQL